MMKLIPFIALLVLGACASIPEVSKEEAEENCKYLLFEDDEYEYRACVNSEEKRIEQDRQARIQNAATILQRQQMINNMNRPVNVNHFWW